MNVLKLFKAAEPTPVPESERFYCARHGDLSHPGTLGGARFGDYPFCPRCLGEWLSKNFPIQRGRR